MTFLAMITYCKNFDITNPSMILPFVENWFNADKSRKNRRAAIKLKNQYNGLDGLAIEIANRIKNKDLALAPIHFFEKKDPSSGKVRHIGHASQMQQVMDYVAVGTLMPLFNARIAYHQYASIKNRGPLLGAKRIQKWVKMSNTRGKYYNTCKYYDKFDVRHCFESIKAPIVEKFLKKDIGSKNKTILWFVMSLIATHGDGLSIGSYLSQWLANYILSFAFKFACELKKPRKSKRGKPTMVKTLTHVLFYMDDIILFSKDKSNLKESSESIINYMKTELGLDVKPNHNVRPLKSNPIDMMGFVIKNSGVMLLRARKFIRSRRTFLRRANINRAKRMVAYYGDIKNCSAHKSINKKYHSYLAMLRSRKMISNEAKANKKITQYEFEEGFQKPKNQRSTQ